ncbi:hypothetical protein, partial [Nonomuraea insulae]
QAPGDSQLINQCCDDLLTSPSAPGPSLLVGPSCPALQGQRGEQAKDQRRHPVFDITRTIQGQDGRTYDLLRRIANPPQVRLVERRLTLSPGAPV